MPLLTVAHEPVAMQFSIRFASTIGNTWCFRCWTALESDTELGLMRLGNLVPNRA